MKIFLIAARLNQVKLSKARVSSKLKEDKNKPKYEALGKTRKKIKN